MSKYAFLFFFSLIFLMSCADNEPRRDVQEIIGNESSANDSKLELEIEKTYRTSYDRRKEFDIVENLFEEELKSNGELASLIQRIDAVDKMLADSSQAFTKYNDLNKKFYRFANRHLDAIQDTVLKKKVKSILRNEEKNFSRKMNGPNRELQEMNNRSKNLKDNRVLLKFFTTLPLIQNYQTEKMPDINQLKSMKKMIDELIDESEQMIDLN